MQLHGASLNGDGCPLALCGYPMRVLDAAYGCRQNVTYAPGSRRVLDRGLQRKMSAQQVFTNPPSRIDPASKGSGAGLASTQRPVKDLVLMGCAAGRMHKAVS